MRKLHVRPRKRLEEVAEGEVERPQAARRVAL